MGLIAEEVAKDEPLLVTHNDKGEIEGVKYDRVGVVLINAVKEQQAQLEQYRAQLSQQQTEIAALKRPVCAAFRMPRAVKRFFRPNSSASLEPVPILLNDSRAKGIVA